MTTLSDMAKIMLFMRNFFPNYSPHDSSQTAKSLLIILGDLPTELLETATIADSGEIAHLKRSMPHSREGENRW